VSSIIDFLEKLGQDAHLRHATSSDVQEALMQAGIEPAVREAILTGDEHALESRLGARSNVCCLIYSPIKEDEETEEEGGGEGGEDETQEDEKPKSQDRAPRLIA
jgi:hypothetical protein